MLHTIGYWLYVIGTHTYFYLLNLVAIFNDRAQLFVNGRKQLFEKIEKVLTGDNRKTIWFHVSSLGEFEQARPVIEQLKLIYTNHKFIVTVFSPSGFEPRKNDAVADYIFYLPNDSEKNAKKLISLFQPELVFWIKYDFWFHYLNELKKQHIPTFLIDASFQKNQIYFKKYAVFYKQILASFTHIFTQNINSKILLQKININQVSDTGDTRYDRVFNTLQKTQELPLIELFKNNNTLVVIGSSYILEEEMMAEFIRANNPSIKLIIAPHFVNHERIAQIEHCFTQKCIRYSKANTNNIGNYNILIIDNIGMLNSIYKYTDIAFIGGGFKPKGLHNILEAATFSNAIIFGDAIHYFPEAKEFLNFHAAISLKSQLEFNNTMLKLLNNNSFRKTTGNNAQKLIFKNIGAAQKIVQHITQEYLYLK